mmetsp:Transcript_18451/g.41003  ORF Transcript_18451/g.41003 Transcript_18451/m.41003 type:complete len:298 (+) Transcript_18451:85-978(+)
MNGPKNCCMPCLTNLLGSSSSLVQIGTRPSRLNASSFSLSLSARPSDRSMMLRDISTRHSPTDLRTRYISSVLSLANIGRTKSAASETVPPAITRGRDWTAARRTRKCESEQRRRMGGRMVEETKAGVTLLPELRLDDDNATLLMSLLERDAISASRLDATVRKSSGVGPAFAAAPPAEPPPAAAAAAAAAFFFFLSDLLLSPSSDGAVTARAVAASITTLTSSGLSLAHSDDSESDAQRRVSRSESDRSWIRYGTITLMTVEYPCGLIFPRSETAWGDVGRTRPISSSLPMPLPLL